MATCPECNAVIEEKLVVRKERLLIAEGKDDEQFFNANLVSMRFRFSESVEKPGWKVS